MTELDMVQKEISRRATENVETILEDMGSVMMRPPNDVRVSKVVPTCDCNEGLCSCEDKAALHCPCCGEIGRSEEVL